MIFMLICTEGKVSEPALIRALVSTVGGQAPTTVSRDIEVLPLSLGGNHGHVKLIEIANRVVAEYSKNEIVSLAGDNDIVEKWIVVDHDDMEKRNVDPGQLREEAQKAGYTLIISKPKFEFFVLATLSDLDAARATRKDQLTGKINSQIRFLNENDASQKGFSKEMLMPMYSKREHVADKLFGHMLGRHPELIDKMISLEIDIEAEKYSEMPKVIQRITELYKG